MFLNIWKISVGLGRIVVLGQTQAWEHGGGSEVGGSQKRVTP